MPRRKPVFRFAFSVLLMLPIWFLLWYLFAPLLLVPVAGLSEWILTGLWPDIFTEVEQHGRIFEFITTFIPPLERPAPAGLEPVFSFSLNPLSHGYGLPLLLSMGLAVPGRFQRPGYLLAALLLLLIPVQAITVSAMGMYGLFLQLPPEYTHSVETDFGGREGVVLVYKMATLALPTALPVVLWGALYADYLRFLNQPEPVSADV